MTALILGTAQLGMSYGVANTSGQPDQETATAIVRAAWEGGIRTFDTAQEYGTSEYVLGRALHEIGIGTEARVVSKLRKDIALGDTDAVVAAVRVSLARLHVSRLFGLLIHKEALLDEWRDGMPNGLRVVVREGLVEHIGASVYVPERALQAIATDGIGIIQVPGSIVDDRCLRAGVFARAGARGKIMMVRSVFLQGLLLMDTNCLPVRMAFARPLLSSFAALAASLGVSLHGAALQYAKRAFPDAQVMIGAESLAQVEENIAAWNARAPSDLVVRVHAAFPDVDPLILNPSLWPKN